MIDRVMRMDGNIAVSERTLRIGSSFMLASFTAIYSLTDIGYLYLSLPAGALFTFFMAYYWLGKIDLRRQIVSFATDGSKSLVLVLTALSLFAYLYRAEASLSAFYPDEGNWPAITAFYSVLFVVLAGNYYALWHAIAKRYAARVVAFFRRLDRYERGIIVAYVILMAVVQLVVLARTNAFVFPQSGDTIAEDVIFQTDTAELLFPVDGFSTPNASENDFRQLLFGVVGFPLAMAATPLAVASRSLIGAFGGEASFETVYGYWISVFQAGLFALCAILIARMLATEIDARYAKLFGLVFLASFSTVMFAMTVEQYALSALTLLLFVYAFARRSSGKAEFAAAGTTLTSSFAMLPFALFHGRASWRERAYAAARLLFLTFCAIVFFGQLYELMSVFNQLFSYSRFAYGESISAIDKLAYFRDFVPSQFVSPLTYVRNGAVFPDRIGVLQLAVGAIVLASALFSMRKLRSSRLAAIAGYWMLVSFALLGVIGWGVVENSYVLYTSCFAWAYLIGFALSYDDLFRSRRIAGTALLVFLIVALASFNAWHIADIVERLGSFR